MNDPRVFVTLDSRGRLVRFPSGLVVPAPDGPPPVPPWQERASRRVRHALLSVAVMSGLAVAFAPAEVKASAGIMLAAAVGGLLVRDVWRGVLVAAFALTLTGCALKPLPGTDVVRVQEQAIRCTPLNCARHIASDCEDKGGMRSWGIVEIPIWRNSVPTMVEISCEGLCWNGMEPSHDCVADPPDWRVAEVPTEAQPTDAADWILSLIGRDRQ